MNSPKYASSRPNQPGTPGKLTAAQLKTKSPQGTSDQPKILPTNKTIVGSMQKQLSPVSRPLEKPKISSTSNLQSGQFAAQRSQIERVYSPNAYLEPQRKLQTGTSPTLGQKPQPSIKAPIPSPTRNIAPRMSEEPMTMAASKTRFAAQQTVNTKKSMIQAQNIGQRTSPIPLKQKRAPRMSQPVNSPYNIDNNPDAADYKSNNTKESSVNHLPIVPEETSSNRFMRNKPAQLQIPRKGSDDQTKGQGQPLKVDSPNKTPSPTKSRSDSNERGFIKKFNLTETVSTDSNSNSNSNYRALVSSPRISLERVHTPSSSPTRHRTHKVDDFVIGKQLGCGKFGNVFVVKHKLTGFVCALKIIPKEMVKEENIINQLIRELKIQSCLDHPNIIKLFGFFDDEKNVYLLLELGSSGQLYRVLKEKVKFSEEASSYIVKQICEAIRYLHTFRIIHRDIKPENIVIQHVHHSIIQGIAKMCDFGWAVCRGLELRSTFCGTPLYVSPEILKGEHYDERIDLWSIGILCYELLVGDIPFEITREQELIKIVMPELTQISDEIRFPEDLELSPTAKDFIFKILQKNPEDRLKISQLLEHPFLNMKTSSDVCNEFDF